MRSFSLVLLRRLLFRPATAQRVSLYDHLGSQAIETLQRILLHSLQHEPAAVVRRKTVDTVTDLSNNAMKRGHPWPALQPQVFAMSDSHDVLSREAAFRVFAGCPNLIIDLQTDAVVAILQKGLQDPQSTEVSLLLSSLRLLVVMHRCSDAPVPLLLLDAPRTIQSSGVLSAARGTFRLARARYISPHLLGASVVLVLRVCVECSAL